jgi:hypothetical protein
MLINLSNHPYEKWSKEQKSKARELFGSVADIAFPHINPAASEKEVLKTANEYFKKITQILDECANEPKQNAVHIQGEFTFVFAMVTLFLKSGIRCVASTSERMVEELNSGEKIVKFAFIQFRDYLLI